MFVIVARTCYLKRLRQAFAKSPDELVAEILIRHIFALSDLEGALRQSTRRLTHLKGQALKLMFNFIILRKQVPV